MTNSPLPPGRPEEHDDDPTGVRALLAGLGDPGPMPADLVDRINASIAAEQLARGAGSDGTVVPLRRRAASWPSWSKVGLAAAAVAAVAVAVPAMLGSGPRDVMASLSGGSSFSDSAGSASGAESGSAQAPDAGNRAASSTGAVRLGTSGTTYTSAQLTTQVRSVLDRGTAHGLGGQSTTLPGAASERGLRDCLTALGVASWMPVVADVGSYDGRPAVVAVVSTDTGQSVYAVARDCDAAHPGLLAGPLPLP